MRAGRHSSGFTLVEMLVVITARCDGSVHWMSDNVFIGVWRALSTAAAGELESGL